jgi:hypothetical protein
MPMFNYLSGRVPTRSMPISSTTSPSQTAASPVTPSLAIHSLSPSTRPPRQRKRSSERLPPLYLDRLRLLIPSPRFSPSPCFPSSQIASILHTSLLLCSINSLSINAQTPTHRQDWSPRSLSPRPPRSTARTLGSLRKTVPVRDGAS